MVELYRRGRSLNELAKEFGCKSWSIRQWIKQVNRDAGLLHGPAFLIDAPAGPTLHAGHQPNPLESNRRPWQ